MDGIRQWQGYDDCVEYGYVPFFGDFLNIGSKESFEQNVLFRLSPPRKAARPAGKACRPGPTLIWKPPLRPAWPLRNTESRYQAEVEALKQVGWRCQSHYFHRLRAVYRPKLPISQSCHNLRVFHHQENDHAWHTAHSEVDNDSTSPVQSGEILDLVQTNRQFC